MNKKKLIINYILQVLAVVTILIMFSPIIKVGNLSMTTMDIVRKAGNWVDMEEYLFGIAGIIGIISLALLLITTELGKLSALGVIKNKKLDLALYIINIVLVALSVGVIVNYFLGLGRTIGKSGLKLFQGKTWFSYSCAYFYLYCVFTIGMLVACCLNKSKKK